MAIATKNASPPVTETRSKLWRKQALVAIMDVILQYADIDDLLPQLIETVQQVMQVDNVAILLLDSTGQMLLMNRVRGPEEAVADQVRVPLGQGVAGRIAASGRASHHPRPFQGRGRQLILERASPLSARRFAPRRRSDPGGHPRQHRSQAQL